MDPEALLGTLLVLAHLIAFALAAVGTAFCDYAILVKRRLDIVLMHRAARLVAWALCALWATGLAVASAIGVALVVIQPRLHARLRSERKRLLARRRMPDADVSAARRHGMAGVMGTAPARTVAVGSSYAASCHNPVKRLFSGLAGRSVRGRLRTTPCSCNLAKEQVSGYASLVPLRCPKFRFHTDW